jgi:sulfatase modifying factor 1
MKRIFWVLTALFFIPVLHASATAALKSSGHSQQAAPDGMIWIKGGPFIMGTNDGNANEAPAHQVTVSGFFMDKTEVTQAEYKRVMKINPAQNTGDSTRPVEYLTWFDAVLYCNARSKLEGKDTVYTFSSVTKPNNSCTSLAGISCNLLTKGFRLPTEAEWEYACRAGSATAYWWGADTNGMGARAWSTGNGGRTTHPVATKLANAFGLYDMSGNVWEWCNDWYGPYAKGAATNPAGPASGTERVLRGGSWNVNYVSYRSSFRLNYTPAIWALVGFRVVLPR